MIRREGAQISGVKDLGKTVAIPQIGNTQHLSLLKLLEDSGLKPVTEGGNVTVSAVANADVANAMARVVHFLQNVLHFLEQIFPFTSSFILQHEPSVLLYTQQPGKELAVGIFIRVQSPATEKGAGIPCGYLVGVDGEVLHLEAVVVDLYTS